MKQPPSTYRPIASVSPTSGQEYVPNRMSDTPPRKGIDQKWLNIKHLVTFLDALRCFLPPACIDIKPVTKGTPGVPKGWLSESRESTTQSKSTHPPPSLIGTLGIFD